MDKTVRFQLSILAKNHTLLACDQLDLLIYAGFNDYATKQHFFVYAVKNDGVVCFYDLGACLKRASVNG